MPRWQKALLAHIRFNERVDADGSRVLFIEELQSDWAQQAKKNGFTPTEAQRQAATRHVKELLAEQQQHEPGSPEWDALTPKIAEQGSILSARSGTLPRAPFVGKTEAWVALAVKRMIRYAVENGFDKIALIDGQQSVDRYSLEKHVREVRVARREDGNYSVFATRLADTQDGTDDHSSELRMTDGAGIDARGLMDLIGKDLADKAVAELAQITKVPRGELPSVSFSGLALRFGGDGMKAFYDNIVPNIVNGVLKKLGGGKMAPLELGKTWEQYLAGRKLDVVGDKLFSYGSEMNANAARNQYQQEYPDGALAQPGFAITDGMRDKALAGMPLFSRSAMKSADANIRRGEAAMNQALLGKTSVHRAMFRTGMGWIDFEWGDKKKGIAHILDKRTTVDGMSEAEVIRFLSKNVVATIASGSVDRQIVRGSSTTVHLAHGENIAILVKNPGSNGWMLSAFEKWPSGEQGEFSIPSCLRKPRLRLRAVVWELAAIPV